MGRIADWWLNRKVDAEWSIPISSVQGFRPVGGFLIGSAGTIEARRTLFTNRPKALRRHLGALFQGS